VPPLMNLNRAQPKIRIVKIEYQANIGAGISVSVEVSRAEKEVIRDGQEEIMKTEPWDLRLFREGQLVGYAPQTAGKIQVDPNTGTSTIVFSGIRLPKTKEITEVEFSAYAFNVDQVKSATDRKVFPIPKSLGMVKG